MVAAIRLFGFLATAIGIELGRGFGLAALALAMAIGALRWTPLWLLPLVAVFSVVSTMVFDSPDASGKIEHGLSNVVFAALVYAAITITGLVVGRIGRRLWR